MTTISSLQTCVHTLVLDTTYCNPQQEAVIQYVLEAIQAEAFNPRTLFLIGSYTIGKMRVLECLGMPKEDMQWLTMDERGSHIHVVHMWTLASFKRLKHVSNMYMVLSLTCTSDGPVSEQTKTEIGENVVNIMRRC